MSIASASASLRPVPAKEAEAGRAAPPAATGWRAAAEGIAEVLKVDAAARDQAGAQPRRELELLREAGLFALLDPAEYGGAGGSFTDTFEAVRIIGQADASIAQLLAYHYLHRTNAVWRARPDQRADLIRRSVAGRWFWGGASNPRDPESRLTPDGDDFRLTGRKNFASNAALADRITLRAELGAGFAVITIPGDRAGVSHGNDWDAIGQRLSESGSVAFDNVHVERDEVLGDLAHPVVSPRTTLIVPYHQLLIVNFYIGTAAGALSEAAAYIRTTSRPWQNSGVARASDDPYILEHFGNLDVDLRASIALGDVAAAAFEAAVARGDDLTPDERNTAAAAIYAAKVHASRAALDITSRIFELMGARAAATHYGFDRYWRNIRTHTLHDPVTYKSREVGNFALNGTIAAIPLYS